MDIGLLILRVALGLLIIGHGSQKAFGWFHGPGPAVASELFHNWGFRPGRVMVYLAATTECVGGLLILLGLATPAAASILIGTLAIACVPNLVNGLWAMSGGYELALLYCVMAVVVGFTGAGAYSIDHFIGIAQPMWAGAAALGVGFLSTLPLLVLRHVALSRDASSVPAT